MRREPPRGPRRLAALAALCACGLATAAADDLLPGEAQDAPRWGGVVEARQIVLQPRDEPTARVQQAVFRLTFEHRLAAGPALTAHAEWQSLHASHASALQRLAQAAPAADRAWRLARQRQSARDDHTLGFDWLYLQGGFPRGRYTVGRQPITPSIGRLWSPADLFAPFLPNDLERLYKPGVDAAQLSFFPTERLALTTVASGDRHDGEIRWHAQQRADLEAAWGKSFALIGTRRAQRLVAVGGQVNGVAGNDLHAELLWHRGPQALGIDDRKQDGVRAVLGATRKLAANTVGTLEYFHQSRGTRDPARYDAFARGAADIDLPFIGVGRHYAGLSVSSRPHPLFGVDLLLLANLGDRSAAATVALEYTPLPDLKLRSTLSLPAAGAAASEYRRAGRALQLGLQWFF